MKENKQPLQWEERELMEHSRHVEDVHDELSPKRTTSTCQITLINLSVVGGIYFHFTWILIKVLFLFCCSKLTCSLFGIILVWFWNSFLWEHNENCCFCSKILMLKCKNVYNYLLILVIGRLMEFFVSTGTTVRLLMDLDFHVSFNFILNI